MKKSLIPQPAPFKPQPAALPPAVCASSGRGQAKLAMAIPPGFVPKAMLRVPAPYQHHTAHTVPPSKLVSFGAAQQAIQGKRVSGVPAVTSRKPTPPVPAPYRPSVTTVALQAKVVGIGPARRAAPPPAAYRTGAAAQPVKRSVSTFAFASPTRLAGVPSLIQRSSALVKPSTRPVKVAKPSAADVFEASRQKKAAAKDAKISEIEKQKAEALAAQAVIDAYPDFNAAATLLVADLFPKDRVAFRKLCSEQALDPSVIVGQIAASTNDPPSRKHGLWAFASGKLTAAQASYLAANYVILLSLKMRSADLVSKIYNASQNGIIEITPDHYRDDAMQSATVYIFGLRGTDKRIVPEWHVHWDSGKKISKASFKDNRFAVGDDGHEWTGEAQHNILRQIVPSNTWGG